MNHKNHASKNSSAKSQQFLQLAKVSPVLAIILLLISFIFPGLFGDDEAVTKESARQSTASSSVEVVGDFDFLLERDESIEGLAHELFPLPKEAKKAYVERVVDGDTVILQVDGERIRTRLLYIDAPESKSNPDEKRQTEIGTAISDHVEELLDGKYVYITTDKDAYDQYDRLLALLWTEDGTPVNASLVARGWAEAVYFQPNTTYKDDFYGLEELAQEAGLGIWR